MKFFDELVIGDSYETSRTVTETDVVMYGGVSGDFNPAHFDEEAAKKGMFKTRIAHGMLSSGYISAVLGMHLPGPGTIYLSQTLKFLKPVFINDTITTKVEVVSIDKEKKRATLKTECINQAGKTVITGEAVVIPPLRG